MNKILFNILFIFLTVQTQAQEVLRLEEAVRLTLEQNFDIQLAQVELDISERENTAGNAGMLPNLAAVVNNTNSVQNATLTQISGQVIEIENARNFNISYGLALEWTVFDGFRMFARSKQLQNQQNMRKEELRWEMLAQLSQLYQAYAEMAYLQSQIRVTDSILEVSDFRLKTAQNRYEIGKASKLEVLNADIDRNADLSLRIQLENNRELARIRLNELLGRAPDRQFVVEEQLPPTAPLQYADLLEQTQANNPMIQGAYLMEKERELELQQAKASRWPSLSVNAGYNFVRSQTPFGFIVENEGTNLNYGFSARMNLFDGWNQNRMEKVGKLRLEQERLRREQQNLNLQNQLNRLFEQYLAHQRQLELEEHNRSLARENMYITLEKFKIGSVPALEFRTAQVNYFNAENRYAQTLLLLRQNETALREVSGSLQLP